MKESSNSIFERDWKEIKRQACHVYTRVMWYLRMVSAFNIWKKSEFYSRKNYTLWHTCNREFIDKYSTTDTTVTII